MTDNEYSYVYKKGNLIKIYENKKLINKYYYDESNRIIREDNSELKSTITYKYDNSNHLIERKQYNYSTKSKLKNVKYVDINIYFNNRIVSHNEEKFDYINNKTSIYRYANIKYKNNLLSDIDTYFHFEYENGLRVCKIAGNEITNYFYSNNKLIKQENDITLNFIYNDNEIVGFEIENKKYNQYFYYVKNYNNDVIAIVNDKNVLICKYNYDILGNCEVTYNLNDNYSQHIADINPFRFHSYYFDIETGLYYINGKYYDSQIGTYIN